MKIRYVYTKKPTEISVGFSFYIIKLGFNFVRILSKILVSVA